MAKVTDEPIVQDSAATEYAYCLFHQHLFPTHYPPHPRPDLPLRRPLVVAERPGQLLLCQCEHDGVHMWPDGDEAGDG